MCRRVEFEARERIQTREHGHAGKASAGRGANPFVRSSARFKRCQRVTSWPLFRTITFYWIVEIDPSFLRPARPSSSPCAHILLPTIPPPTVSTFFALLNRGKVPLKRRLSRLPVTRAAGGREGEGERIQKKMIKMTVKGSRRGETQSRRRGIQREDNAVSNVRGITMRRSGSQNGLRWRPHRR